MIHFKRINWPLVLFAMFFLGPILGKILLPLLIIGGAFLGGKYLIGELSNKQIFKKVKYKNMENQNNNTVEYSVNPDFDKIKKKLSMLLVGALILILIASGIRIVDAGNTGVYSLFGKVSDAEISSGFHIINPFAKVTHMSIRTEEYTMSILQGEGKKENADAIAALTKEGLNVDLDMTVLYHLEEESASDVYSKVGLNYEEKIIRPEIRSVIREVIAKYEAKDIYSDKRQEAARGIKEELASKLIKRGIVIEEVLLRNVQLPSGLANSIQEKLQAEQEAQKFDFLLEKEKKEKERKIIEAEGQKESQRIINESLTPNYLYYSYINQLKDREGTIYVPVSSESGMPIFRGVQ